ncbi:hypothetical protein GALMADRAFT_145236 [Galerina marginata CBS 339.88]|uniref:G domain-containing protein n=1 Tax=Galerina marginata (strain CBS 339.88) TaxID=685588 RepID=A0A067SFY7_GALM3|nr:hypothetical protein GALMADRAFT_145236 [Galerina marginata CBS 339.88]
MLSNEPKAGSGNKDACFSVGDVRETDILIPVLGHTGAGKSYFINTVLKHPKMLVGTDLDSCTAEIAVGCIENIDEVRYPNLKARRILLIDTPGFDDTQQDDYEILKRVATWLKQSYKKGARVEGVIYLHDITNDRFNGTARRNLKLFQDLCGKDALKGAVLATTKWSRKTEDSEKHHQQLVTKHWKPIIDNGARVRRFDQGYDSAWLLIDTILFLGEKRKLNEKILLIQTELVKQKKIIPETRAAITLRADLQRALDLQKTPVLPSAQPTKQEKREELQEVYDLVQNMLRRMRELKLPLTQRFKKAFGLS